MLDDPSVDDATYDKHYDELVALEQEHPELVTPDSPTQRVGAPASERFQKVRHLTAMGSLEKVTTDEAVVKWADDVRKRLGARRAGRVRARAEDRRPCDQPHLRGRRLHPRRDARRRRGRGGRHRQPAHDQRDPAAHARRRRAAAPRGARRGVHAALRLPRAERAAGRRGARSRRRTRATPPPARCARRTRASPRRARCRSGRTASACTTAPRSRATGRRSRGSRCTASRSTRSPSGSSRSTRSRRRAATGSAGAATSTTRSTGS